MVPHVSGWGSVGNVQFFHMYCSSITCTVRQTRKRYDRTDDMCKTVSQIQQSEFSFVRMTLVCRSIILLTCDVVLLLQGPGVHAELASDTTDVVPSIGKGPMFTRCRRIDPSLVPDY